MNWTDPTIPPEVEKTMKTILKNIEDTQRDANAQATVQPIKISFTILRVVAEIIETGYNELAKCRQPNFGGGGTVEQMQQLNEAREWLRSH
jgi:hypothetical protein